MGKGSSGLNSAERAESTRYVQHLEQTISEYRAQLEKLPTKAEISKEMNNMVRNGTISAQTRDDYNYFYDHKEISDFGREFENLARGYKYQGRENDNKTRLNTVSNLRDMSFRESEKSTLRDHQKNVRDLGAYIIGKGRYDATIQATIAEFERTLKEERQKLKNKGKK